LLHSWAYEYLDKGWSIIPISPKNKKPLIEWKHLQERQPTHEEVDSWFDQWGDFGLALVTGHVSGILVVDADTPDAVVWCRENRRTSPFGVATTRGQHYYFKHPGEGQRFPNVAHNKIRGHGLFGVPHLDFRGDGGYVVLPPTIKVRDDGTFHEYAWLPNNLDWDDLPVWQGKPTLMDVTDTPADEFSFASLDLSHVTIPSPLDHLTAWEQAAHHVGTHGKLGEGDGRNDALIRYAGEMVRKGVVDEDLERSCNNFQDEFFKHPLEDREFRALIRSAMQMDRRNHPDDYNQDGSRKNQASSRTDQVGSSAAQVGSSVATMAPGGHGLVPLYVDDDDAFDRLTPKGPPLLDPLLPSAGHIVMLYAWTGHGKSVWLTNLMWHLAAGKPFGGMEPLRPMRVLYLDYENGPRTVAVRRNRLKQYGGNAGKNLAFWLRSVHAMQSGDMNLLTPEGRNRLAAWLNATNPEVLVIDTLRSAFPGLEENKAEAWSPINELLLYLRSTGLTVIVVHHANKPNEHGLGKEAGSSNQLTVVETHMKLTQIFDTEEKAEKRRGKFDAAAWQALHAKAQYLHGGARMAMAVEIDYEKLRDPSDNHAPLRYGFAFGPGSEPFVVGESSPRQKAVAMAIGGQSDLDIAQNLGVDLSSVKEWLGR
jgi:hypothetical protein